MAGILWVVGREDSVVGRSDDLHSIPHAHIWVPLPPVSVVGECRKLWERIGLAVDAAILEQPDGELVGRRGCKENKKPRESRVPCSNCPGRAS